MVFGVLAAMGLAECRGEDPTPAPLVVTQIPLENPATAVDELDRWYPNGSRVVWMAPPFPPSAARNLSGNLAAAGHPVVSHDGQRVVFVGKVQAGADWQIYETTSGGGLPKPLTTLPGGAMGPVILGHDDLVFSSPVPKAGQTWSATNPAALFKQAPNAAAQRLTFGSAAALEPTVLRDGTILFVSAKPAQEAGAKPRLGLYTINDDGTEVTAYAVDGDGLPWIHKPRELMDGRVGFLASTSPEIQLLQPEAVRTARPFASRKPLLAFPATACRAIEPDGQGAILISMRTQGLAGRSMSGPYAIFRIKPGAAELGTPLIADPAWNLVEAVAMVPRPKPLGHISAMKPAAKTGTILCLNAHFTRDYGTNQAAAKAVKVRVVAQPVGGKETILGETALQTDGSFLATVPVEVPLGFELVDGQDQIVRRLPPSIWLRPGENRSCLGCHEPYNRSPKNHRPIAAGLPPANLSGVKTSP